MSDKFMINKNDKILVTQSYLPDQKKYSKYLEKIWKSKWLTNNGVLAQELEYKLKEYLGVKHLILVSNGTVGLQLAIKTLNLKKKIITTPFSFIATSSSIIWENCEPIFVDIDEGSFCIDVKKIEKAITPDIEAILAVHVYGNPCLVKEIERISKKHNLKVIYDAAHAFGVKIGEKSISEFGDISVFSFHATKVFHTGEGGAVATDNDEIAKKIRSIKDFGYVEDKIEFVGINGKMSEFHAAMGLCVLKDLKKIFAWRKNICGIYDKYLANSGLRHLEIGKQLTHNFSYYPVVFKKEADLIRAKQTLKNNNIFPRQYFCPSINTLPFVKNASCPVSESLSKRVLCLPLYHGLSPKIAKGIARLVIESLKNNVILPK